MVEGTTQLLGRRLARTAGDFVSGKIMTGDLLVLHRQIAMPPLEVAHGITARIHHIRNDPVSAGDRFHGTVDEQRFGLGPFSGEPHTLVFGQGADVEILYAFLPVAQFCFRIASTAFRIDGTVVFFAELIAQGGRFAPLHEQPDYQGQHHHHYGNDGNRHFLVLHHALPGIRLKALENKCVLSCGVPSAT